MATNIDVLLAGALAAFTVDLLVYPLDTIKTRLQSPSHRSLPRFAGLYQGVGSVVLATLPASGAFFTTYETIRTYLPASHLSNSLASSSAELVSCLILTPSEVIKQHAQVISPSSHSSPAVSSSLRALRAIKSPAHLFTGYSVLAARNLPFTALHFPLFEALKARWTRDDGPMDAARVAAAAAGVSAAVAATITTPIDVVKTRVMLRSHGNVGVGGVVREVLKKEGMRGLWKGGALRAVWAALGSAIYLGVYEGGKVWFGKRRDEKGGVLVDL